MQICKRQGSKFGKCPVTIDNSQHSPVFTVGRSSIHTLLAPITSYIDLPHYTLTDPRVVIRLHDFSNKLMPQNTGVWVIAFYQFKIGAANPSFADLDQR